MEIVDRGVPASSISDETRKDKCNVITKFLKGSSPWYAFSSEWLETFPATEIASEIKEEYFFPENIFELEVMNCSVFCENIFAVSTWPDFALQRQIRVSAVTRSAQTSSRISSRSRIGIRLLSASERSFRS